MNKPKKILNAIAATGSIITYIYCIMNLSAAILAFTIPYDAISFLINPIFIPSICYILLQHHKCNIARHQDGGHFL